MKILVVAALAVWSVAASGSSGSPERPPLPYYDWGACPFECCTYRDWKVIDSVTAYRSRSTKASIAFKLKKDEWVRGVTGVVVTYRFGETKIMKPVGLGYPPKGDKPELFLQPGEVVYTLHYVGEGFDLFWYKGNVYYGETAVEPSRDSPLSQELGVQVISRPEYVWWVQIRNKAGMTGWTRETDKFDNMDACG